MAASSHVLNRAFVGWRMIVDVLRQGFARSIDLAYVEGLVTEGTGAITLRHIVRRQGGEAG